MSGEDYRGVWTTIYTTLQTTIVWRKVFTTVVTCNPSIIILGINESSELLVTRNGLNRTVYQEYKVPDTFYSNLIIKIISPPQNGLVIKEIIFDLDDCNEFLFFSKLVFTFHPFRSGYGASRRQLYQIAQV